MLLQYILFLLLQGFGALGGGIAEDEQAFHMQ